MAEWTERLRAELEAASRGVTGEQWRRAPEGCWSAAQIMEHLGRSYGTTAKMLELAMNSGGGAPLRPFTMTERFRKLVVVTFGYFPSGRKAPALVCPDKNPGAEAIDKTLANLERMEKALDAAEARWGKGLLASHLLLGPLTADEWRKFHYLHGHHHLKQVPRRLAGER